MPRYRAFGLTFDVDFACPQCDGADGLVDVRVCQGEVVERLETPVFQGVAYAGRDDQILLSFPGVARFLVERGAEITYAPASGASVGALRTFLLGPVFGTVLLQRGVLPLHASACVTERGAVLLAGYSGGGKSTILAALALRGCDMLTDDLAAVTLREGVPVVHRGFGSVRLHSDSLTQMGGNPEASAEVRPGVNKFWMPFEAKRFHDAVSIAAVCVLNYGAGCGVECEELTGQTRLAALVEHTYARGLAHASALATQHFFVAGALANRVPMFLLKRPRGLQFVESAVACLADYLR